MGTFTLFNDMKINAFSWKYNHFSTLLGHPLFSDLVFGKIDRNMLSRLKNLSNIKAIIKIFSNSFPCFSVFIVSFFITLCDHHYNQETFSSTSIPPRIRMWHVSENGITSLKNNVAPNVSKLPTPPRNRRLWM